MTKDKIETLKREIVGDELYSLLTDETVSYKDLVIGNKNNATKRAKDNAEALLKLKQYENGEITKDEAIEALKRYSGNGGTTVGSDDEYYTPNYIAGASFELLNIGDGAKVLDPSAGAGSFVRNAPDGVEVEQVEISETSSKINSLVNGKEVVNKSFEEASKDIQENSLDGVITNAPFMERDKSLDDDPFFRDINRLEDYFLLKSLQLVKYGKRVVMLMPTGVVDRKNTTKIKKKILNYGSFLGAIRLPNKVFSETGANVAVDIVVFEKHPENTIKAIKQGVLKNIADGIYKTKQNSSFLNGTYFDTIGKKNIVGIMMKDEEFVNSRFNDNHSRGTQVLTKDSIEEIKEKIYKKVKTRFFNDVNYDELELFNGYKLFESKAGEFLNISDLYLNFFRNFLSIERVKISDIKEFREKFIKLGSFENRQALFSERLFNGKIISAVIATNYHEDDKKAKEMFNTLDIFADELPKTNKKLYSKHEDNLKKLISKKNIRLFKCPKDILYSEHYNEEIVKVLANISLKVLERWDFEKHDIIDKSKEMPPFKTLTFDEVAYFTKENVKEDEKGRYIDPSSLKKEDILASDELALLDGKIVSFRERFAIYGKRYGDVKKDIESVEFNESYGLTLDEFEQKKQSMLEKLETFKVSASVDKLFVTINNVDLLVPKEAKLELDTWANDLAERFLRKKPFQVKKLKDGDFRNLEGTYQIGTFLPRGEDSWKWKNKPFVGLTEEHKKMLNEALFKAFGDGVTIDNVQEKAYKDDKYYYAISPTIKKIRRSIIEEFNTKLDLFCKQNHLIRNAMIENLENDSRIGIGAYNESDSGRIHSLKELMTPSWVDKLHGYQNEDINKFSNTMSGVIAAQTGLGKTAIAIGTALKALQTKRAKRILFVVPNGVFDKWKMEMLNGKTDENGNVLVQPVMKNKDIVQFLDKKSYNEDYSKFCNDSSKRILFITYEQLGELQFKDETIDFLRGDTKKDIESKGGLDISPSKMPEFSMNDWAIATKKSSRPLGYFEDGNFDLIMQDEAQMSKNSLTGGGNYKFASSIGGVNIGVKSALASAYIKFKKHGGNPKGTILVTATPFTNTPYEIFTTLKKLGRLENVKTLKDFESLFMRINIETKPMATQPDREIEYKVFKGLVGIDLLKANGLDLISYRTAENEAERPMNNLDKTSIKPDKTQNDISSPETYEIEIKRRELLGEYEEAKSILKASKDSGEEVNAETRKKASAFNLLSKIDKLSISSEFADGIMSFNVELVSDDKLNKLVSDLEKKKITVQEYESAVVKGELVEKQVNVKYTLKEIAEQKGIDVLKDGKLTLPTTDVSLVEFVLKALKDEKNILDIEKYPKYKALFENIHKEVMEDDKVKQIVFSLSLSGARIIERLAKDFYDELEVVPHKILSTLNVKKNKKSDDNTGELAKFQEEYNSSEIATVLIFTKAHSTGVDFNKNTKAVHLVDIPFTPDVFEQAEGRAVRQGNKVKNVNVYTYAQDGTFDEVKKEILSSKGDWQQKLLANLNTNANSIDSLGIDRDIFEEAIERFGVNFTKDDVKTLIEEKRDEQVKANEKALKIKIETLEDELGKVVWDKNKVENYGISYTVAGTMGYDGSSAKLRREVDINKTNVLKVYKKLLSDMQEFSKGVLKYYRRDASEIGSMESDVFRKADIDELYRAAIDRYFYNINGFQKAFKTLAYEDEIELGWSKGSFKNPLTTIQRETLKKQLKDLLKSTLEFLQKKEEEYEHIDEKLDNTVKALLELDSENEVALDVIKKENNEA